MSNLTDKQKAFCNEYILDRNATQSAIRAGYSKNSAGSIGEENLKKPEIREFIDELEKDVSSSIGLTKIRIAKELRDIAFLDKEIGVGYKIKAIQELNKMFDYYGDNSNDKEIESTESDSKEKDPYENWTTDQLERLKALWVEANNNPEGSGRL